MNLWHRLKCSGSNVLVCRRSVKLLACHCQILNDLESKSTVFSGSLHYSQASLGRLILRLHILKPLTSQALNRCLLPYSRQRFGPLKKVQFEVRFFPSKSQGSDPGYEALKNGSGVRFDSNRLRSPIVDSK